MENDKAEKIIMQVVDMYGRIIETRNVNANSPIRFGDRYNPGTYFCKNITRQRTQRNKAGKTFSLIRGDHLKTMPRWKPGHCFFNICKALSFYS
jgi:hypothetical protein